MSKYLFIDTSNYIEASAQILKVILGSDADFRLGKTKIFLQNNDDVFLQRVSFIKINRLSINVFN